jgi:hypothetical protein
VKNLILLVGAALVGLSACAGINLQTPEGQCRAAEKALIVAKSESADADMIRRAELAVLLSCED